MTDPFEVLGVEPRFDLDLAALEARHRDLSRTLHPDRFVGQPAGERRLALSRAIEVNDALRALKDPIQRASLLLARRGFRSSEGAEPKPAPEFLMSMLELRESLSDAERQRDIAAVRSVSKAVEQQADAVQAQIAAQFAAVASEPSLSAARVETIGIRIGELRFLQRLLSEAHTLEDELS